MDVRDVGRIWSPFSIGHLYLTEVWQAFVLKNGHRKDTCYDEIGLCAHNIDIVLRLS